MNKQPQLLEVEEINSSKLDSVALKKFLSQFGKRIGSFQSSVGFHRGIYLNDNLNFFDKKLEFVHVVGGPRKGGYLRYSIAFFLLHKDGHISFHSILYSEGEAEITPISLEDLNKMIELANKYLIAS